MKKTGVILALALGLSIVNLNATNQNTITKISLEQPTEISPLCKAVVSGNTELVKTLIKKGADVNAKSNGMQPIHYAAKYNRVDMIKLLITSGSKIHSLCDSGYSALEHAKKTNAKDAELFLKRFKNKSL